jgi:hypothetical protein
MFHTATQKREPQTPPTQYTKLPSPTFSDIFSFSPLLYRYGLNCFHFHLLSQFLLLFPYGKAKFVPKITKTMQRFDLTILNSRPLRRVESAVLTHKDNAGKTYPQFSVIAARAVTKYPPTPKKKKSNFDQ